MRPATKKIEMKYIDADKLIAEIQRHIKHYETSDRDDFKNGELYICQEFLSFIASLQQEQTQVADASKMERLNVDILRDWSMKFAPDIRDAIKATAYHFWDLAICSMKEE